MNAVSAHVTGFQHLGLPTSDMEKTLEFYTSLGFELALDTKDGDARVCFLKLKNICIESYEDNAVGKPGAWDHVALDVDDVEAAWAAVKAAGHTPMEDEIAFLPFWEKGVRFFNIKGPNGETVEFSQIL